jgi:glycosyltransferase involved in cell wall biosynthesis
LADRRLAFAIPGDIDRPTGGYGYDRRLIAGLRAIGWTVEHLALPGDWPWPTEAARAATFAGLEALPAGVPVMIDGLAFGAMEREAKAIARVRPLVALCHHPLALEAGLPADRADALERSERAALAAAHAVVVTSPATGETLVARFGVPPDRLTVAVPGTDRAPFARGSGGPETRLLAVGTLIPRKGHLDLVEALARISALPWRLDLVGDATADPAHATLLAGRIEALGLTSRITLIGPLDRPSLERFYDAADLFVLASHYEGYGMAYAEAMAHGLAVVGTTGGAIPGTVGAAGDLVPPGDVAALAAVLARLISDPEHRAGRAAASRRAAAALPDWQATARTVAAALEALS